MTRYEQGFMNKCAEYGVDGRQFLHEMQKIAVSPLTRLAVKLHPQVDPNKMNRLIRKLFTTTSRRPVTIIGSNEFAHGVKPNGSLVGYATGASSSGKWTTKSKGMRSVTRLSPEKILAALSLAGGAGALASSGGSSAVEPSVNKRLLALLSAGALGTGAAALGASALRKGRKGKGKDEGEEDKDSNDKKD